MKETHHFLYLSLLFSILLHLSVFYTVFWNNRFLKNIRNRPRTMVTVQMVQKPTEKPLKKVAFNTPKPPPALKPLPVPIEKPKIKRVVRPKKIRKKVTKPSLKPKVSKPSLKKTLPPSNTPKAKTPPNAENIKPVFGLNRDSLAKSGESGTSVRFGNTLMKAQEEEFTPPDEVKTYASVPAFELTSMPIPKTIVKPEYPPYLKSKEIEGVVLLLATIDENGKVVKVTVKRSENELFTKAAVAALKQCTYTPAKKNDTPVTTAIPVPIKFFLDK